MNVTPEVGNEHEGAMAQPHPVPSHRGKRVAFTAALVAFLLRNISALMSSAVRRSVVDHPMWGYSPLKVIQLMETYEMLGRLCALAAGIHLLVRLKRSDQRWPGLCVRYGVAYLVFEATLYSQYFFWGAPVVDRVFLAEWARAIAGAALIVGAVLAGAYMMTQILHLTF
ncbi:MAG TPA: hypothetical protein VGK89_13665 [Candidatus Eisenbacteria bacterium]|jgi:hypothetical protein